jgi:hypothetical protein
MKQQDHFHEEQAPPGLTYFEEFVSDEDEKTFIKFFKELSFWCPDRMASGCRSL